MSIATELSRIQTGRNTIRNKFIDLGIATSTDNLDKLASAAENITNHGAISANVKEGETYTIPKGYHSGSGTVSGVAGGGNYALQSKAVVTPTKKQQQITPDEGYYGMSDVTVGAIPDAYQDVTSVTAAAGDVLTGKVIVSSTGVVTTGTMTNNGAVTKTIDTATTSYTIPAGYHNGKGTVSVVNETKSATPTKAAQDIVPTTGKVLSKVTVNPIPDAYQDITGTTATAADVLPGKKFVGADGTTVEGAMPNNGAVDATIDTSTTSYTVPAGYHDGTGTVKVVNETKSATPTKASQTVTPTTGKVLSSVTVNPIPDQYQDISVVTAGAADVLTGKKIVGSDGAVTDGTMANNGAVSKTLTTADASYTVPVGYHNGEGTVQVVPEDKSATPTKAEQEITATEGKVLNKVTVAPIPDAYQDVTGVTATADKVLKGSSFVDATGAVVEGTMANNGRLSRSLTTVSDNAHVSGDSGYYSSVYVSVNSTNAIVTPTKSKQTIRDTTYYRYFTYVTVDPIPDEYQDVTDVDATAAEVLAGKKIVDAEGTVVTGTMANNGDVSATIDGLTATSVTIPAGYTTGGTVSLTSDIEEALAAI